MGPDSAPCGGLLGIVGHAPKNSQTDTAGVDIAVCLGPRRHYMSDFVQTLSALAGHIGSCLKLRLRLKTLLDWKFSKAEKGSASGVHSI
jgi:hypothetical protein